MNDEFQQKLFDDFPHLFRNRNESCMQRGFECGDGWYDLIYTLSRDIEAVASEIALKPDSAEWPMCRQVKEKFGTLRFYVFNCHDERIHSLIHSAYEQSCKIHE